MRRSGLLVAVSTAFVAGGIWMLATPGSLVMGIVTVAFFGACLLVGLAELRQHSRGRVELPAWVVVVGCAGFTLACGGLLSVAPQTWRSGSSIAGAVFVLVCVTGIVFFGGGGVYFAVRQWKSRKWGPQG